MREVGEGRVLVIDKPYRWTSADVIRKLKYAAIKYYGKKNLKVGHAGTLDPLATGVLLVCIGPQCKRAQQLQDHDKEYIATIRFGATTPSYDLEKEVDRRYPFEHITEEAVREALKGFVGEQEQVAPLFSAKSVDGQRAYELARRLYRSGRFGEIDAAALETLHRSRIVISEIELLSFTPAASAVPSPVSSRAGAQAAVPALACAEPAVSAPAASPAPLRTKTFSPNLSKKFCPTPGEKPDADAGAETPATKPGAATETATQPSAAAESTASSRINVADTSALGLPEARIRIVCSKGTYIRALARDLGEALGSGAHLAALQRTRSGDYRLADALPLDAALALFSCGT